MRNSVKSHIQLNAAEVEALRSNLLLLTQWRYMQHQTYLQFGLILSFEAIIAVKSGQISRLRSHKLKYNTDTVFH